MTRSDYKHEKYRIAFWILVVLIWLTIAAAFSIWILIGPLIILMFIHHYKQERIPTLWFTLGVISLILIIMIGVLTFGDHIYVPTGTEWHRVDPATCEKVTVFKGFDSGDCRNTLNKLLNEVPMVDFGINSSDGSMVSDSGVLINSKSVPQCYEERCK